MNEQLPSSAITRARVIALGELHLNSIKQSSVLMYSLRILSVLRKVSNQIPPRLEEPTDFSCDQFSQSGLLLFSHCLWLVSDDFYC